MQGGFWPGLEPVDDSGVDGGQEALTADAEICSYRTGGEHHVQVVLHLQVIKAISVPLKACFLLDRAFSSSTML